MVLIMSDKNKVDTNVGPSDCLAEQSRFTSFICKDYPISCDECLYGWHSLCKVSNKDKNESIKHTKRPVDCPLIKPYYYIDKSGYKYPSLDEANWLIRNPVLTDGAVVISKDLQKAKIGNGKAEYASLPFLSSTNNSDINTENNNIFNMLDQILSVSECNILYSLCEQELANIQKNIDTVKYGSPTLYSANSAYIDSLNTRMLELITIKLKIHDYLINKEK